MLRIVKNKAHEKKEKFSAEQSFTAIGIGVVMKKESAKQSQMYNFNGKIGQHQNAVSRNKNNDFYHNYCTCPLIDTSRFGLTRHQDHLKVLTQLEHLTNHDHLDHLTV